MSAKLCASCNELLNGLAYECIELGGYVGYRCCIREKRHGLYRLGLAWQINLGLSGDKVLTDDQALAAIQSMPGLLINRVRVRKYIDRDLI
jgi:hypothetical protein